MAAQVCSVPGQTEGRRKAFLEWTTIDLSSKLYLTCKANVNYSKRVHHPNPTLPVGIRNTQKLSFQLSVQVFSLVGQSEGETKAFFEGWKKGEQIVRLPPRSLGSRRR